MDHPAFKSITVGEWESNDERGKLNHTLYALDETGEVWRLLAGRWVVVTAPRDHQVQQAGNRPTSSRREPF